ncbi:hypothetical protein ABTM66_19745, partial [Acinetobacter baumannii]
MAVTQPPSSAPAMLSPNHRGWASAVPDHPKPEMISPNPVNFQITTGHTFMCESDLPEQGGGSVVVGAA